MSVILVGQDVQSKKQEKVIMETHKASLDEFEIAKKELEELRSLSTDIRRIISELEARQSLKAISLETGRPMPGVSTPENQPPIG